ncbi:hypothetical protein GEMRC1_010412 [Eukaryota sp. GEM-RC1]
MSDKAKESDPKSSQESTEESTKPQESSSQPPKEESSEEQQTDVKSDKKRRKRVKKKVIQKKITRTDGSEEISKTVEKAPEPEPEVPKDRRTTRPKPGVTKPEPRKTRTSDRKVAPPAKKKKEEEEPTPEIDPSTAEFVFAPYPKKFYVGALEKKEPDEDGEILVRFYGYPDPNLGWVKDDKALPFDVETFERLKSEKKLPSGKGYKLIVEVFKHKGITV